MGKFGRLLILACAVVLLLSGLAMAGIASPLREDSASALTTEFSVDQGSRERQASAVGWSAPGPGVVAHETGAPGEDIYIILHQAPSLAQYRGEVPGLAATSPRATGAIRLDVSSAASVAYLDYLEGQHERLVSAIQGELSRSVEVTNRYDAVLNGIAVRMNKDEAAAVAHLAGILHVERNTVLKLSTDNGPRWMGADAIWGEDPVTGDAPCVGDCGEGVIVGVIDTGINWDHPSFADIGGDGYDHTNPRAPVFFGLCAPITGLPFCNDKLIGLYDFSQVGGPEDDNGHGSHTASTAAGNVILAAELIAPTQSITRAISGVAPHANIIAYKACNSVTGNCLANGILGSINQATLDGVDVINFSIGGSSGNPWTDLNSQAFFDSYAAGIFVAASAGNDGPGFGTLGSPADAPWVTAVGASTHDRAFVKALIDMTGGDTTPPADISGVGITAGWGPATIVYAGDYAAQSADPPKAHLCGAGTGNPATGEGEGDPWPAGTFDGEIVVCDRGEYGRVFKGEYVRRAGAGGYVLANDAANGDSLVSDPHVLPAIHITFDDGVVLKAWLADGGSGHTATITATELPEDPAFGDVMAAFSSRGANPSVPDVIKPDVTAPGVSIFAAWMSPGGVSLPGDVPEYNVISGTSMSSPHTAGAAALVRGVNPSWTPDQVKSALMTTAFTTAPGTGSEVHGVVKEDGATPADPFDMGGGRVDLRRAADAGFVLEVGVASYEAANPGAGGDPKTLNIASFGDNNCIGVCSWTRTLEGTSNGGTWTASTTAPAGMTLTVSPSSFTLNAGGTQVITVTANVAGVTPKGVWTFAEVRLTPGNAAVPEAHFPVAVIPVAGTSEVLHLHGNVHDECADGTFTGNGAVDLLAGCDPFMSPDPELDPEAPAARWGPINPAVNGANPQNVHDPNWIWVLTEPTTLQGPMVVEWWAAGPGHNLALFNDYFIRLFADGVPVTLPDGGRVRHTGQLPNVPQFLRSTIDVPEVTASDNFVLQIDPIFVNQAESFIYYDSEQPCPGGTAGVCDSRVSMPVVRAPTNDPPVAQDDNAFVANGGTVIIVVLANDFDPDGDPLTVEIVTQPVNGVASVTVNREIQYTHDGSATTTDSLVYRITDIVGQTDEATVFITISAECTAPTGSSSYNFESGPAGWTVDTEVNTPPSINWTLTEDASATSPITSWFSDALAQEPIEGGVAKDDRLVSPTQFVSGITHLTFWHRYGFEDLFDGGVLEVSLNDGASWQDIEVAGGVFVTGGYVGQIDPANPENPLRARHAWTGASDPPSGTTMSQVDVNLAALGGNEVLFRWRLGQDELVPSNHAPFGWYLDDVAFSNLLEVDPNCVPNDPPVAGDDQTTVARGGSVNIDVTANDFDPDDDPLTVEIESDPAHGTAVVEPDDTITYTHNGDTSTSDSFQYRVTDPSGAFDVATVFITISNQAPVANDDSATVNRGQSVTINVKANDNDPDDTRASLTVSIETPPSHGSAGVTADGQITYTHDGSAPTSDSFQYRLTDPQGASDVATVSIRINQSPPNAVNDAATTRPRTPVTVFVKANDFDPDGDPIDVTSVTDPPKGTAVLNADDSVTYTPDSSFTSGTDSFQYTLVDDRGGSDTATVTITVSTKKMPDLQVTELQAVNNRPDDDDDDFDNDGEDDDEDDDDDNDGARDDEDDDDDNDNRDDDGTHQGDEVTITATIRNTGTASAGASKTEFLVDGFRIALVDTGSIPAGGQRKISIVWDTSDATPGPHTITSVADRNGQVAESNETNNSRSITYTVQPNQVPNGDFEEDLDDDDEPESWSRQSTGAGTASYSNDGCDGSKGASMSGNGGSAARFGSPTWTSAPIAVTAGRLMDLQVSVRATDMSSASTVSLVYLSPLGDVLQVVTLLTVPLSTLTFEVLEQAVTIPEGVAAVQIVLTAFAPTDLATAGTVTFDEIGLFEH
jgi:subtilisin family serine protease